MSGTKQKSLFELCLKAVPNTQAALFLCTMANLKRDQTILQVELDIRRIKIDNRMAKNFKKTQMMFYIMPKLFPGKKLCHWIFKLETFFNQENATMENITSIEDKVKLEGTLEDVRPSRWTAAMKEEAKQMEGAYLCGPITAYKCAKCNDRGYLIGIPMTGQALKEKKK